MIINQFFTHIYRNELPATRIKFIKIMKRKSRGKYSYAFGNNYPVHNSCFSEKGAGDSATVTGVPKNMGWRWDKTINGTGNITWYPGKVNKTVRTLMKHTLNPYPYDTIPLTRRDKNGRILKTFTDTSVLPEFNPALIQKPALHIKKSDGEYSITLNPLKDAEKLKTSYDPFLNCAPLKFKVKKNPEEIRRHKAKKLLRSRGFIKKCSCNDLRKCRCMDRNEKKILEMAVKKVSTEMKLKKELMPADLYESSDSEMDVAFTTASSTVDPRKFPIDIVHTGTQYNLKDFVQPKSKKVEMKNKPKPKAMPEAKIPPKAQSKPR